MKPSLTTSAIAHIFALLFGTFSISFHVSPWLRWLLVGLPPLVLLPWNYESLERGDHAIRLRLPSARRRDSGGH